MGDVRLLRHADRLERRDRARARAPLRRRARRRGSCTAYHELERAYQREHPTASYREVLTVALARLAEREGLPLAPDEHDALARSLPGWEPFPDVRAALEDARARGWKLAILSNTDRDYIEASLEQHRRAVRARDRRLGDRLVQAGARSTGRPSRARRASPRTSHVHVGASLFHDIAPAIELGLPTVWINRLGEDAEPRARRRAALADRPRRRARLARMNVRPITDARLRRRRRARCRGRGSACTAVRRGSAPADVRGWLDPRRSRARLVALRGRTGSSSPSRGSSCTTTSASSSAIVAQGAKGRGLGTRIVETGEARRESGVRRACTRSGSSRTRAAAELFVRHGYRAGAALLRDGDRARGGARRCRRCRKGSRSRRFQPEDARAFYEALDAAFQDHWEHHASASSAGGRRSRTRTTSIRRSGSSFATATRSPR